MTRHLASDRGIALVIAVIVTTLMMGLGLSAYAYVDSQSQMATQERQREAAFNVSDAVLAAQGFVLSQYWPAAAANAYPDCSWNGTALTASGATTNSLRCPDPGAITQAFTSTDHVTGTRWSTIVRDNAGASLDFYDPLVTPSQPSWDANGDGEVWLRATSHLRKSRRTVVVRLSLDRIAVLLPKYVLTTGTLSVSGGPKPYIVQNGSSIALRCASAATAGCYSSTKPNQVKGPGSTSFGYPATHTLAPSDLDKLRQTARANGTYYASGCPASPAGALVFVESGTCSYGANGTWNSAAAPGMLVVATGTLTWTGNVTYHGTIYMYNQQNATCPLFDMGGSARIYGAVLIDGPGCFQVRGNSQLSYDANAVRSLTYNASISQVRNSFREIN